MTKMPKKIVFTLNSGQLPRLLAPHAGQQHFRIHTCSNIRVPPAWHIPTRVIDDFHLLYVRGGRGQYIINGHPVNLHAGLVVFLSNGVSYAATQDLSNPPEIIPIRFCAYDNTTSQMTNWQGPPIALAATVGNPIRFAEHFRLLHEAWATVSPELRNASCSAIIHIILQELQQNIDQTSQDHPQSRLQRVRDTIINNPGERYELSRLAKQAGLCPKYFSQLFKQRFGLSPKQLVMQTRMQHAHYLLTNTQANVSDVARSLGYGDPFIFSRQFKTHFGFPPSQAQQGSVK